jgi:hypothetical protein
VDDFGLNPTCFELISGVFGPLEVDQFASEHTMMLSIHDAELTRFNAFYWCLTAEACNAFTQDWSSTTNYCFPPPYLVARTLAHARACGASMVLVVLVVLEWDSQVWWPLLRDPVGGGWHRLSINTNTGAGGIMRLWLAALLARYTLGGRS